MTREVAPRPMPEGFAEYAEKESVAKLVARFHCRNRYIRAWIDELGLPRMKRRGRLAVDPVPADFAANAAKMHKAELCRHYRAGSRRINDWLIRLGISAKAPPVTGNAVLNIKPLPDDFLENSGKLRGEDLRKHYGCSPRVLTRWKREAGIPERRTPSKTFVFFKPSYTPMAPLPQRDGSEAGRAQLFLQRYGPVFRASTINPNATGWIMFGRRVSEADLLATAYRKGFRAEAMAA